MTAILTTGFLEQPANTANQQLAPRVSQEFTERGVLQKQMILEQAETRGQLVSPSAKGSPARLDSSFSTALTRAPQATFGLVCGPVTTSNRGSALRAAPRRIFKQSWTKELFARMARIIAQDASSAQSKAMRRCGIRRILARAEGELSNEHQIKPAWLAGFLSEMKNWRHERSDRASLGRLLVTLGFWTQGDYELLEKNLGPTPQSPSTTRRLALARPRKSTSSPPDELSHLVTELAYHGALALREIQRLRVTDIQSDGLRILPAPANRIPGRMIPFGSGAHALSKALLDAYIIVEKPEPDAYLFFCRSPRDKRKLISRQTLTAAVAKLRPGSTIDSLRDQHFKEDFDSARDPREARFHFRNIHGLSDAYARDLIAGVKRSETDITNRPPKKHYAEIKGFVNEAESIPIPAPYLLAAFCASRSVPEENARTTIPESGGGKRHLITWNDLCGYEIAVDWPRRFATELGGRGQRNLGALRLLFRLAFDFWYEGRRVQRPHNTDSRVWSEDRELLDRFASTMVSARDRSSERTWSGYLFEYGSRKRSFRIPLIEELATRLNGFAALAKKYSVSSISLRRHCGRVGSVPGRGERQRSHFSIGHTAPMVSCPRRLFAHLGRMSGTELMVYALFLLENNRAGLSEVTVSSRWIEECLGLRLDESQLSHTLNHLSSAGAGLVNFRKLPNGFHVELLGPLKKFSPLAA